MMISDAHDTLLDFPCTFPIKAMGLTARDIAAQVQAILVRHAAEFAPDAVRERPSANGKWCAVTVVIQAHSKAQLDAIYQDLSAHPDIVYAL